MRKIGLYALVSLVSAGLAQSGLALSFGLWRWPIIPSIFFSLAVSVAPAFVLSDLVIWRKIGNRGQIRQRALSFFIISAIGSGISLVVVWLAVRITAQSNFDHAELTLIANFASVGTSAMIWIIRYFILDRVVFRVRTADGLIE